MAQSLGVTPDHTLGQELAQTIEFLDPNSVLETRQRRLRGQVATLDRIAIQKQFVNRILGQSGLNRWRPGSRRRSRTPVAPPTRATNDPPCPLADRLETGGQSGHQIHSADRQPSAARLRRRTPLSLIELGHDRPAKNSWEQQTLCCAIFRHSEASFVAANIV